MHTQMWKSAGGGGIEPEGQREWERGIHSHKVKCLRDAGAAVAVSWRSQGGQR